MHTEETVMASAVAVGIAAACAVMFAFFKPLRRFVCGSREFADALGAGIWVRAVGTLGAGISVILRVVFHWDLSAVFWAYLFGWSAITAGYWLHFSAWRGAYFDRKGLFSWGFLLSMIATGLIAFAIFSWLAQVPAPLPGG